MKRGSFAAGFLTCLLLVGISTTAYAAGIMAERSTHRVLVDGQEVQMEAYEASTLRCSSGQNPSDPCPPTPAPDPSQMTLAPWERFCFAMLDLVKRWGLDRT